MGNGNAFVVPQGASLALGEAGYTLEYSGDITLHGDLGGRLDCLRSQNGSITLHGDCSATSVTAGGAIVSHGTLKVESIQASRFEAHGIVQATSVKADQVHFLGSETRALTVEASGC
ncbi:MAG: hypothetical protein QGG40_12665, partial [Myxococcota bacterium]|nr:hypothetical protein [Myxococcota bacterium]